MTHTVKRLGKIQGIHDDKWLSSKKSRDGMTERGGTSGHIMIVYAVVSTQHFSLSYETF